MSNKYRYDHRSHKHRKRHILIVTASSLFITAVLAIAIIYLIDQTTKKIDSVSGPSVLVGQITSNPTSSYTVVNEPDYSFELPTGWRQISVESSPTENDIAWESFVKDATNRYFTIYTDPIPTTYAVNLELPLEAHGSTISFGTLSGNCANFTNSNSPRPIVPVLAKWQNVDFYCNSPNFADNQVGTGTVGAINSVTVVGPKSGTHHYFFLYIDRNSNPDYSILYTMLNSFQAK
jgi:hypothetical protein